MYVFFFFFSSRRRHTRFDCDWSSDVCSSDLASRRAPRRGAVRGDESRSDGSPLPGSAGVTDPARERYARVQAAMARRGVGALLLATPHLAAFASGARRVQVAGSGSALPSVVIVAGAPSAVVFTADPDGAPSWMARAAVEPLAWDRERALRRLAELVAPVPGKVACDVFSPALRHAIGRPLVDAAPLVAEAAAPRTADEIAAVQTALRAARAGLRAAVRAAAPGAAVSAIVAGFAASMSRS